MTNNIPTPIKSISTAPIKSIPTSTNSTNKPNVTFLVIALVMIIFGIFSCISASSSISTVDPYSDTTTGKIIGSTSITSSPYNKYPKYQTVYEYTYRNIVYKSVLIHSSFQEPGQTVTLRINPKDPENITLDTYTPPFNLGLSIMFSAITLIIIGGIMYYMLMK